MRIDLRELLLVIVAFLGIFYFNEWQTNMIHKQEVITCYDKLPNINGKLPLDSEYNPYQSQPRNLTLDQLHFADLIAKENLKDDKSADLLDFYANASSVIAYNHLLYVQTSEKYTIYRYELLKGISRTCNSESVYSEVSRITLSNIKQYFWMIQSIYESLNKCNSILVSNVQNKEPSYNFGSKNDELLQAKNVLMYKKIKTVLVGSERKSKLMAAIDLLLYYVFQLSNTCLERFYLITNTPESEQIKLFDMAYSVEDILDGKKQGDEITDDEKNRRKQAGKQNINFIEDTLRSAQEERYSSEHEQKND